MATVITERNPAAAAEALDDWRIGRTPVTDLFAADMRWRIEGPSPVAGTYTSTADFVERVLAPFGARFRLQAPFRPTVIRSVVAEGDTVVVAWDGHGIATTAVAPGSCASAPGRWSRAR